MNIYQNLANVQQSLKATKDLVNKFGGYNYRSCESILEAVKPLLAKNGLALTLTDEMVQVGGRIYVKATATVFPTDKSDEDVCVSVDAFAREEESKKGMDSSQVTGAASSYARKYALNGLFCIDDNKDSDATNTHGKDEETPKQNKKPNKNTEIEAKAESLVKREGDTEYALCSDCGGYVYPVPKKDGSTMSVKDFLILGLKDFNAPLCKNCYKARFDESKNK